ncbi:MAG: 30S ribosomal protein S20 [Candidatus Binatia bacterium]|nr:MAG: 30S ribosomal protein S20 [Candidatus Binatia bacterium]
MARKNRSAEKRHRQSLVRRARNRAVRTRVRHQIRKVREAIARGDAAAAAAELKEATRIITKAASKGVLHRNTASRYVARLSRKVASLAA